MKSVGAGRQTLRFLRTVGLAGLCALALGQACAPTTAINTAAGPAAVQARAPGLDDARLRTLLAAIDLNAPGLDAVRQHAERGDARAAASALLAHYRSSANAAWVRSNYAVHRPDDLRDADAAALVSDALGDTFTFQGVRGRAPRTAQGDLDWTHRGPRDDLEWALFFNRHFLFVPLVEQYRRTRDPAIARFADATMRDWILSRPVENVETERQMSASWRPMSTASRLLQAWPHVFFGFLESPDFSDDTRLLMLASIPEQAAHLQRHHRRRHNHTIKEMAGLAHAAAVWPEFKNAGAWRDYALTTLEGELSRQFYPDGVHQELSAHYHRSALEYFVWVKDFEAGAGRSLPAAFAAGVERAADYLAASMSPQGEGPLNNNGDLDDNRALIAALAERFARPDWRHIASGGQTGVAPSAASRVFPWAGQAIFRNGFGRDAQFSLFDFGPWGAAHQHDDKLNLTLSAHGRALLTDGGRYRYAPDDPVVAYLRGSAGHNVILVDGKGQNPDIAIAEAPAHNSVFFHDVLDAAIGAFDAGYRNLDGPARHQRAVMYLRNRYWLVIDRIESDRPRSLRALWRFAHDATVAVEGVDALSTDPGLGNVRITPVSRAPMRLSLARGRDAPDVMGWFSPGYNDRRAATVAQYDFRLARAGVVYAAWVMSPAVGPPARRPARIVRSDDGAITVDIDGARFTVDFAAHDAARAVADIAARPARAIFSFQDRRGPAIRFPQ